MLELVLRERVAKLPEVQICDGVGVTALTGTRDEVTGVVLATGERIAAGLVVDCTGRACRSDRWMTELGLPVPEQIDIKIGLGYATRLFRRGSDDLPGWKGIITLPTPPKQYMVGVAFPIEDDRWLVSLIGWHVDDLPADEESFTAAVLALPDPAIARLLDRVVPVTEPVTARLRSNHRRLFERLGRVPAGYVALGDAICSFNPFYGHGMTCAVQEAVALGTALRQHGDASADLVRDYYQAAAAVVAGPWQIAVDGDFAYAETSGPRPRGVGLRNTFASRLMLASQVVPELKKTFFGVLQLVEPPEALMKPAVVMQVLRHGGSPSGGGPMASFMRRNGSRRWLKAVGLASAPMDRVPRPGQPRPDHLDRHVRAAVADAHLGGAAQRAAPLPAAPVHPRRRRIRGRRRQLGFPRPPRLVGEPAGEPVRVHRGAGTADPGAGRTGAGRGARAALAARHARLARLPDLRRQVRANRPRVPAGAGVVGLARTWRRSALCEPRPSRRPWRPPENASARRCRPRSTG